MPEFLVPEVEIHRTPPPEWRGKGENIGYMVASGHGARVVVPCSLALLDDDELVDHYIKTRLLRFYDIEVAKQEKGGTK